ncbi:tail protein X [Schinkia azotoformans]|uniref:tail protein X n=1 Tax=Schinkia azotoformans TaxID=1454 RepID=UPI002DB95D8F|nr:tail protein X [Schinkia azotoformans]MEC1744114.1 tail protein X [Schinkia azotoformans]
MSKIYRTVQGDMWDSIAKKTLGSEYRMSELLEANPTHIETVIFSANVELIIPDIGVSTYVMPPPWLISEVDKL